MPKPPLPKCESSENPTYESYSSYVGQASIMLNGMCETATKAVNQERRILREKLKKKQNLITELTTRLKRWNDMRCCYCKIALKDQGPRVPAMYELAYIELP